MHYFKSVRTMLRKKRFTVYHSSISWAARVNARAEDLRKNILMILQKENCEKVNIIAHSMGGLNVCHMLFNDRLSGKIHNRIASVTTISTSHEGSPFADWGTDNLPRVIPGNFNLSLILYLGKG